MKHFSVGDFFLLVARQVDSLGGTTLVGASDSRGGTEASDVANLSSLETDAWIDGLAGLQPGWQEARAAKIAESLEPSEPSSESVDPRPLWLGSDPSSAATVEPSPSEPPPSAAPSPSVSPPVSAPCTPRTVQGPGTPQQQLVPRVAVADTPVAADTKVPKSVALAREKLRAAGLPLTGENLGKILTSAELNRMTGSLRENLDKTGKKAEYATQCSGPGNAIAKRDWLARFALDPATPQAIVLSLNT